MHTAAVGIPGRVHMSSKQSLGRVPSVRTGIFLEQGLSPPSDWEPPRGGGMCPTSDWNCWRAIAVASWAETSPWAVLCLFGQITHSPSVGAGAPSPD